MNTAIFPNPTSIVLPEVVIKYDLTKVEEVMPKIIKILEKSSPLIDQWFEKDLFDCDKMSNDKKTGPQQSSYRFIAKYLDVEAENHPLLGLHSNFSNINTNCPNDSLRITKKTKPQQITGELKKDTKVKCLKKFTAAYIVCKRCGSVDGIIYSRIRENGSIRRPYKNCQSCNDWCWLEESPRWSKAPT